jgi:hypothetical protein
VDFPLEERVKVSSVSVEIVVDNSHRQSKRGHHFASAALDTELYERKLYKLTVYFLVLIAW